MFVSVLGELFSKGAWIHQSTHMIWPLVFQKQKWWVEASHPTHSSRKCDIRWQKRFSIRWCCFLACSRPDLKVQNSHPFSQYLKASFSSVSYLYPRFQDTVQNCADSSWGFAYNVTEKKQNTRDTRIQTWAEISIFNEESAGKFSLTSIPGRAVH